MANNRHIISTVISTPEDQDCSDGPAPVEAERLGDGHHEGFLVLVALLQR